MKAGIITHYNVHNHGAHLQLYALSQCLKSLGYDAKALQFQKNYDFMGDVEANKKYNISIKSIPTYFGYLLKNGLDRTLFNIKKRKVLALFRKEQNLIGEYYSKAKDLDAVVVGSDEIFSIEAGPNPWYFGIGVPCKKQISYAASFGPTTLEMINDYNIGTLVKAGLENLNLITVRDKNSYELVKHFTNIEPSIVCDPVLLYEFPEQIKQENIHQFKESHHEKYCIVYSYDYNMNDETTVKSIREYANKRGLKVYSVAYFHKWCDENINLHPLDIFAWFACADIVFTDTFHGTVISLVTRSQFVSQIRENGNKLAFLLEQYGVSNRRVEDFSSIENIAKNQIDYSVVENTIVQIKNDSFAILKKALEDHNVN